MRKFSLLVVGMLMICGVARAGLVDDLSKLPAWKHGVAYSVADQKFNYLTTLELFNDLLGCKGLALEAGYSGKAENTRDKLVAVLSYDVLNLKDMGVKTPILDLVDFRVGVYGGIGRIEAGTVPVMRGNNETDYGVSLTAVSVKF